MENPDSVSVILRQLLDAVRELQKPGLVPAELLSAREASRLCGVSAASWWRRSSAGEVPAPVRIGGSTRWRRADLLNWITAGCPAPREHKQ